MSDTLEFSLDVIRGHDIAVGKMSKVEFDAGLKAPFERNLLDGPCAFAAIHGRMVVIGRVEMGAVMGRELHRLHRPALTVGQIARLKPRKEAEHARQALLVIVILDARIDAGRIGRHVVLQRHRDIDQFSRHGVSLVFFQVLRIVRTTGPHLSSFTGWDLIGPNWAVPANDILRTPRAILALCASSLGEAL